MSRVSAWQWEKTVHTSHPWVWQVALFAGLFWSAASPPAIGQTPPPEPPWLLAQAGGACTATAPTGIEELLLRQASELYAQAQRAQGAERRDLLARTITLIDTLVQAQPDSLLACQARQPGAQVGGIPLAQVRAELASPLPTAPQAASPLPITGSTTAANTTSNTRSPVPEAACGPLSPARQAIVRDMLRAYRGNTWAIETVASHADHAVLAWAAYGDADALALARQRGWREHPRSLDGQFTLASRLGGGDAVARLFVSDRGEAVLAFRGSTTRADWLTNAGVVLPVYSDQLRSARTLAERARALYPQVTFVGHSLGGAMAQVAQLHTDRDAVIFNSAPVGLHALGMAISGQPLSTRVNATLKAFRSPEDPVRRATHGLGSFEDLVVSNIALTGNTVGQNAIEGLVATGFAHAIPVLARAMQDVRLVRDEGWLAAETGITLRRGESACGFEFRIDGVVRYQTLLIPNAYFNNRNSIDGNLPDRLIVHTQSPSGRYRRIQVCLFECSEQRLVDLVSLRSTTLIHSKHGAPFHTYWNASERHGVVFVVTDGAAKVDIIDTQSMTMRQGPGWGDNGVTLEDINSLEWQSETVFLSNGTPCGARFNIACPNYSNPAQTRVAPLAWQRLQFDITPGRDIQMRVLGPAPAPQGPVASRQTRLNLAIERLNLPDAAGRALISSGVEALLASLLSEQSINALVRLGLSRQVVEANVLQAMENAVGDLSPTGLAMDVVRSALIDAVAGALEQAVFSRAPASTLPASWQAPLRALVLASFAEGTGLVLAVSNPSPTAWVAPMVDRVYDAVEIHRGITGLRQDREVFLYSVALGAEVNAELITRFPGARSQSVLDQWRNDTRSNLPAMVGPGAVDAVSQVIDTGLAALTAQRRGNTAEVARLAQQLQQRAEQFNLPTLRGTRSPRDLVLNLVNAGDAASSLASAFLSGTALRDREQATPATTPPASAVSTVPASVDEAITRAQALGPSVDLVKAYMWLGQRDLAVRTLRQLIEEVDEPLFQASNRMPVNGVNLVIWLAEEGRPSDALSYLDYLLSTEGRRQTHFAIPSWAILGTAAAYQKVGQVQDAQRWARIFLQQYSQPDRYRHWHVPAQQVNDAVLLMRLRLTAEADSILDDVLRQGCRLSLQDLSRMASGGQRAARRAMTSCSGQWGEVLVARLAEGLARGSDPEGALALLNERRLTPALMTAQFGAHGILGLAAFAGPERRNEVQEELQRIQRLVDRMPHQCDRFFQQVAIAEVAHFHKIADVYLVALEGEREFARMIRAGSFSRNSCAVEANNISTDSLWRMEDAVSHYAKHGQTALAEQIATELDLRVGAMDARLGVSYGARVLAGALALAEAQRHRPPVRDNLSSGVPVAVTPHPVQTVTNTNVQPPAHPAASRISPLGNATPTVSATYFDPSYPQSWSPPAQHLGIDLPASSGETVVSPVAGTVVANNTNLVSAFEKHLIVQDAATGEEHVLGHIDSSLSPGTQLTVGQPVGTVVTAGTGPHVHWGINARGVYRSLGNGWGWGRAPHLSTREDAASLGWMDPGLWLSARPAN